jgi:hypothetical protein
VAQVGLVVKETFTLPPSATTIKLRPYIPRRSLLIKIARRKPCMSQLSLFRSAELSRKPLIHSSVASMVWVEPPQFYPNRVKYADRSHSFTLRMKQLSPPSHSDCDSSSSSLALSCTTMCSAAQSLYIGNYTAPYEQEIQDVLSMRASKNKKERRIAK